ncbi:MAG TPA: HNH endonuclease domain-containing protein, partial [Anaerolineae bacterium]
MEPKKRRCPRADRLAQRCRLYQEVNNLRFIDGSVESELTPEQRQSLIEYLSSAKERKFGDIRSHLGFPEGVRFNLERMVAGEEAGGGRIKLKGMETDAMLAHRDLFGKTWHQRPEDEKDQIVRDLIDPAADERAIFQKATTKWGLSAPQAERLIALELPPGYSKFSRDALERLEPHLLAGLPLMRSDPAQQGAKAPLDAIHAAGYLRPDERPAKVFDELPEPPDLPNPLVRQALYEVRRVVNAIIREHGKPDEIHIELARDVKGSLEKRRKTRLDQLEQERRREEAARAIAELGLGVKTNRANINRYLLWKEQGEMCIYTGRMIPPENLFGGEIDVDHILHYPRSLDNSMANRVV